VRDLAASLWLPALSQVESRALGRFVGEAFRARTVEITFLGYPGETIVGALCHHMEELLDDPGPTCLHQRARAGFRAAHDCSVPGGAER
jgi:hypothetical protein